MEGKKPALPPYFTSKNYEKTVREVRQNNGKEWNQGTSVIMHRFVPFVYSKSIVSIMQYYYGNSLGVKYSVFLMYF